MIRSTRRNFLRGAAAVGATTWFSTNLRAIGANDDVRVAVVGLNGRGTSHTGATKKMKGVRLVAVCDADQSVLDRNVKKLDGEGVKVEGYKDIRKMLENKDIDAVFHATPNHWHSLGTIWCCQAGKDVYVEKPISHEILEGRRCVEAAQKYGRVVMHGTQRRSDDNYAAAFDFIKKGNLGKILWVKGFCYKPRPSIGKSTVETPIPANVDYDLWCGPAAKEPLMRKKLHYDWHWVWPTGNGDIGNQGVHEMDMCRWFLGNDSLPENVLSIGGRFGYDDDATTPNTLISYYDYKPYPFIFEVRGLPAKAGSSQMDAFNKKIRVGMWIQCEGGYYAPGEGGGWIYDKDGKQLKQFTQGGQNDHQANFIKAVRSRKPADNRCDALTAHYSSSLCHMGNISHRVGKEMLAGDIADSIKSNPQATEAFERVKEHLAANECDLKTTKITLGANLTMDPKTERFTGDFAEQANKYVTREYRKPFIVPDNV